MSSQVLLVDDDAQVRNTITELLRFGLQEVAVDSCSGQEALQRVTSVDYDAIVTDLRMPGMDGLALLTEARRVRPHTPVVLVSAEASFAPASSAAFAYMSKPLDRHSFVDTVRRAVDYRQLSRSLERAQRMLDRTRRRAAKLRALRRKAKLEGAEDMETSRRQTMTEMAVRVSAETRQEQSAQDRLLLLECSGEGIYGLDKTGRCTFFNPMAGRLLGYKAEEVLGKDMHALIHHSREDGSLYPREECPIYRAFLRGNPCHLDTERFWRKDGSSFPVEYRAHPIVADGQIQGAVVTVVDISARKETEQALRKAHDELDQRVRERTRKLAQANAALQEKIVDLEMFEQLVLGREHKMIALERELAEARAELKAVARRRPPADAGHG